jgi:hypothetical protein
MRVNVETYAGYRGTEMPKRLSLDKRSIEVIENIDRWEGSDHCYFKMKGDDGNVYILRFDKVRCAWELTMFQTPRAEAFATRPSLTRQ